MARLRIAFMFFGLSLILVACNFGAAGPSAPCSVTVSKQAADRLIQKIRAEFGPPGKSITVKATDEEVSSLFTQFLRDYKQNNPNIAVPLENPTVCFKSGQMSLFDKLKLDSNNSVNAVIVTTPAVSAGKAAFKVEQVQVGPLPVPSGLNDQIASLINGMINQNLDRIVLSDIKAQDGQLTLTGKIQ